MSGFKRWLCLAFSLFLAAHAAVAEAAAVVRHARGVNILGYDPYWKDSAKARFNWTHLDAIKHAGFDHVRVNLFAFSHMDKANRLDPAWLGRLDAVVAQAGRRGLGVILDEHDYNDCAENVAACRSKLTAFWQQVAPRYRNAPANVAFELLNEPHGALDASGWNALFASLLKIVRETNPARTVIVGPTHWNSLADLPLLDLPPGDHNLLVTFHYYEPFAFTHQGAPWTDQKKMGIGWGSPADRARLHDDFAKVAAWSRANRRPILLGEFGAYDRSGTPMALRTAYTEAVAREAELAGFGWAYWQFDSDFLAWDMAKGDWVAPIRDALISPK